MPMPENITLANVNEAIHNATILTDNHVMVDRYQEELADVGREVRLMPGSNRIQAHNDPINGPIPLKQYVECQDKLQEEIILS